MQNWPESVYSAAAVRAIDQAAIEHFDIPGARLMARAGGRAFQVLRQRWPRARRLAVVCGPGNNGGDGLVVARLAHEAGLAPQLFISNDRQVWHGDAATAWREARAAGLEARGADEADWSQYDLIVDAIFGTGLQRDVEGPWRQTVESMNAAAAPTLSIDIPSGLHADTGRVLGVAVRAAATVSFVGLKAGLFTGEGREYCGALYFDELGIPPRAYAHQKPCARRLVTGHLCGRLPRRARSAHKGAVGRLLIVGGAPAMAGAVSLAAQAAYRCGAGLVTVATHPSHAAQVAMTCVEAITLGVTERAAVNERLATVQAAAVGPGLGTGEWGGHLFEAVVDSTLPCVLDADALNRLARDPIRRDDWVLTPHPGEAARLLRCQVEDVQGDRLQAVREIARRYGGICVLKGSGSLIAAADDEVCDLCDRGGPALATAGSGDVLTGAIAAFLAQGLATRDAARLALWLHASAGDQLAAGAGEIGLMAGDLPAAMRSQLQDLIQTCA